MLFDSRVKAWWALGHECLKNMITSDHSQTVVLTCTVDPQLQVSVSAQQLAHRDPFYKITQRLPWWPPCLGMTRWLHSISHLSSALQNRSGTDCDSCVTSQAQRAVMLSQASAALHPISPSMDVRMHRLQECSVGCRTTICHISPTLQLRIDPQTLPIEDQATHNHWRWVSCDRISVSQHFTVWN